MIKQSIVLLSFVFLAACSNQANKNEETADDQAQTATTTETSAEASSNVARDPICKMEKEDSWTDYVVNNGGDTVWFCSATCKDAYMAKNK